MLPTKIDVLRFFFYRFHENRKNERKSTIEAAKSVIEVWQSHGIESQHQCRATKKIRLLVDEYRAIRKRKNRLSEKSKNKFVRNIQQQFDVSKDHTKKNTGRAPQRANDEAAETSQMEIDSGSIGAVTALDSPNSIAQANAGAHLVVLTAHEQIAGSSRMETELVTIRASNSEAEAQTHIQADGIGALPPELEEHVSPTVGHRSFRQRRGVTPIENEIFNDHMFTPSKELCLAYDREKISHRAATLLYLLHAKHFDVDFSRVVCSKSTISRLRERNQVQEVNQIFDELDRSQQFTLHWDGKTYTKRGYKDKRLGIVISNNENCRTLNVKKVESGKSNISAQAIYDEICEHGLLNSIKSVCFDTENTNSGRHGGICMRLIQLFGRDLLQFGCRHHIHELVLKAATSVTIEQGLSTISPSIPLFNQFCVAFNAPTFDRGNFAGLEDDQFFNVFLSAEEKANLVQFCRIQLEKIKTNRNDYNELLKLTIIILSPDDRARFNICAPGCFSRARFMCRILYCFKIYLYREQFIISDSEMDAIRRFILFVLKVYIKHWFTSSMSLTAPANDLSLLKKLDALSDIMPLTSKHTIEKLKNHLWFLSEILIAFSFYDASIGHECKRKMVENLSRQLPAQRDKNRFVLPGNTIIQELELYDFVSSRTIQFFEITGLSRAFLTLDPSEWENDALYVRGRIAVLNFTVVNDPAERAIALYQRCESQAVLEDRKKRVVQVVENHRKKFPSKNKRDIITKLNEH